MKWKGLTALLVVAIMIGAAAVAAATPGEDNKDDCCKDGKKNEKTDEKPNKKRGKYVTVAIAMRWGHIYGLDTGAMYGKWKRTTKYSGEFNGIWKKQNGKFGGFLKGIWIENLRGPGGHFQAIWTYKDGKFGGYLNGKWFNGKYRGTWWYADGELGGFVKGVYKHVKIGAGIFGGKWCFKEDCKMVPWNGVVYVSKGGIKAVKTLLFENWGKGKHYYLFGVNDKVYPQKNRHVIAWRSSTTVHWDGIILIAKIPKKDLKDAFIIIKVGKIKVKINAKDMKNMHRVIKIDSHGNYFEIGMKVMNRGLGHDTNENHNPVDEKPQPRAEAIA